MNDKFPALSFVSAILKIVGWAIILLGLYFAVNEGIIEPQQPGHRFTDGDMIEIAAGSLLVLFGLGAATLGEIAGVIMAIELNTRSAKK